PDVLSQRPDRDHILLPSTQEHRPCPPLSDTRYREGAGSQLSQLDYCNSLLIGPNSCIAQLQSVVNAGARLIFLTRCTARTPPPTCRSLHWLPVPPPSASPSIWLPVPHPLPVPPLASCTSPPLPVPPLASCTSPPFKSLNNSTPPPTCLHYSASTSRLDNSGRQAISTCHLSTPAWPTLASKTSLGQLRSCGMTCLVLSNSPLIFRPSRNPSKPISSDYCTTSLTVGQIKNTLQEVGVCVSKSTIKRRLHQSEYRGFTTRCKPLVSLKNRKARLEFAKHLTKPSQFWNKILWTDETKINLYQSDGKRRLWRRKGTAHDPKHTTSSVKHGGGSVMAWACMAANGTGSLVFIDDVTLTEAAG
uniref:Transposase Tc1-like domain-containing protein n=1 Tax=Leptobrachium leishanense TaxID=445787 RepID=A0A8C5MSN8_9ANUR